MSIPKEWAINKNSECLEFDAKGQGKIKISPQIQVVQESEGCTTIDADFAPGSVAGVHAMDCTIEKAKKHGLAMTTVKNGTHFGAAAYYALRAVKENMIGIALTNSVKLMAPYGGYERELGTNPIYIAVPGTKTIVYDGATSIAAYNKIFFIRNILNIEIITSAIKDFRGTVIAVSHDRYFMEEIMVNRYILDSVSKSV